MSEKMAGIFALNVINEKDYMEINGKRIERKEYNGVPILTSWDIAEIHGKETKRINEQFKRNFKRFEEGADYFWVTREYFSEPTGATQKNIPNNIKKIPVYTRRGYIKLTKTFSDDLSWKIQDILIDVYFNTEKFIEAVQNGEIEVRKKEAPTEFEIKIATKYEIKTEEYGYLAYDKSKTSVKQVETFRYFENAVPKFYEIIKEHYSVKYL